MSIQLQNRVTALEAEMRSLRDVLSGLIAVIGEVEAKPVQNQNGPRRMCPKCGTKPNYHLHVINCHGPWQGNGAQP